MVDAGNNPMLYRMDSNSTSPFDQMFQAFVYVYDTSELMPCCKQLATAYV